MSDGELLEPRPELADFWLPEDEADVGDPRPMLHGLLVERGVTIEDPIVVEDVKCPPSFLGISSGVVHTVDMGPYTRDVFIDDLSNLVKNLADLIAKDYNPFQPIRFYQPAYSSYGISPYTFSGDEHPFDLRLIGMAERSIVLEVEGEKHSAPGIKWYLTTMITPNKERDKGVYVATDWGSQFDG